ncbi:MAG: peptidase C15 [Cyanobacteria bacterium P01_C01_bin.120]
MTLLLTSFAPWKAHQVSNDSDDLIMLLHDRQRLPKSTQLLRHLPVHFQLAPAQVIAALDQHRPTTVVCCGLAETRSRLNLERDAHNPPAPCLSTSIDLPQLADGLPWTTISYDAGTFVCNALYYELLSHIGKHNLSIRALFVHVPPLTKDNREPLMTDMARLLQRLQGQSLSILHGMGIGRH